MKEKIEVKVKANIKVHLIPKYQLNVVNGRQILMMYDSKKKKKGE